MRKVAVLIATFAAFCAPGVTADSGARPTRAELSGLWQGTANGSLRGDCPSAEGAVHPLRLAIVVDDAGAFTATCDDCPVFLPAMRPRQAIVGRLDDKGHVTAAQEFDYAGRGTQAPVTSAIRWTGDIKPAQDRLDLRLHAIVRVHTSTSTACVIDGFIRVSKPR